MAKLADKQALTTWDVFRESLLKCTNVDRGETYAEQQKRIKYLEADFERWARYYFPNYCTAEPALFHIRAAQRILKHEEWFEVRAWARELAKSVRSLIETLYQVLTGRKKNIILVSNSEDNARRLLEPYRANLDTNQRIIYDYGIQKSHKWREGDFKTRRGVAFRAIGADQSPRGTRNDEVRPDKIIIDDIDTDQDCRNPDIITKRVNWLFGALIPTRAVNIPLQIVVCGNIIAEYCCVTELMKKADHNDIVNIRTAGVSSWPGKNSEQHIDRVLNTISYAAAQTEYFNNPQTEGRVFKKLNFGKVPPLSQMEQIIIYADPAPSNSDVKNNSYKVVALVGRAKGITYVIKVFCEQCTNAKFIQWFYDLYTIVRGHNVQYWIENNTLQNPFYEQVFLPLFREAGKAKGYTIPIRPDTRKKADKYTRIEGTLEPANRLGLLIFNEKEKDSQDMQTAIGQFMVVSPTYRGAIDAPDCIEGAYKILDENQHKRAGTFRAPARTNRGY